MIERNINANKAIDTSFPAVPLPTGEGWGEAFPTGEGWGEAQSLNQLVVTTDGYSLIAIIEIVVVKDESQGESLNDESRKVFTITAPLFLCVTFNEPLIDVATNQRDSFLFQILRFFP